MFNLVADLLGTLFGGACERLRRLLQMEVISRTARKAFGPDHDRSGATLRQAGCECHGIGWLAKEIDPAAFTNFRGLIREHTHRFTAFQGFEQRSDTGEISRGNIKLRPRPPAGVAVVLPSVSFAAVGDLIQSKRPVR